MQFSIVRVLSYSIQASIDNPEHVLATDHAASIVL